LMKWLNYPDWLTKYPPSDNPDLTDKPLTISTLFQQAGIPMLSGLLDETQQPILHVITRWGRLT